MSKEILGQVFVESASVGSVNIINNATQVATVSDENGKFSMRVRVGDVLVFSAVNLNPIKYRITNEDFDSEKISIGMTIKEVGLDEVIVNSAITAENLGIIPKGQKKYSPAERKLATAGDFKAISLLGLLGGSMDIDPIINKINGRTKKLKEYVEVEKREGYIEQLGYLFEDSYYVNYLKIPFEYVNGFKVYIVENEYARTLLEKKDKTKLAVHMSELALKYNDIISSENK
ncbi:hypothetical protein AAEO57_05385 [Flavobacterium sp. DGU38]|uniref:CarboxypepD_reg-like domain-containing protein n=1 Tax=Flavobacterium calami TaxID=3139144 RepID=A0ABU9ILW7_9FLAO